MRQVKQILLQIFATKLGWLVITLALAVYCGVRAEHSVDEESAMWTIRFWWAIAYPVFLVVFQSLFPFLLKLRTRAMIVFPLGILCAWFYYRQEFLNQYSAFGFWVGVFFLVLCIGLIWFQPGTDNLFKKDKK